MKMPAGILLRKHDKLWTLQIFPVPLNAAMHIYVKSWNSTLEIKIKEKKITLVADENSSLTLHKNFGLLELQSMLL